MSNGHNQGVYRSFCNHRLKTIKVLIKCFSCVPYGVSACVCLCVCLCGVSGEVTLSTGNESTAESVVWIVNMHQEWLCTRAWNTLGRSCYCVFWKETASCHHPKPTSRVLFLFHPRGNEGDATTRKCFHLTWGSETAVQTWRWNLEI